MSKFIQDLRRILGHEELHTHPLCGIIYFFDFLTVDDYTDDYFHYHRFLRKSLRYSRIKRWKSKQIRPLVIRNEELYLIYRKFCYDFFVLDWQLYPTPHVFPDEDSFIDEVLSLSTTITYDYYTKRVTLPPFNVLVKDIKGESDEDNNSTY